MRWPIGSSLTSHCHLSGATQSTPLPSTCRFAPLHVLCESKDEDIRSHKLFDQRTWAIGKGSNSEALGIEAVLGDLDIQHCTWMSVGSPQTLLSMWQSTQSNNHSM